MVNTIGKDVDQFPIPVQCKSGLEDSCSICRLTMKCAYECRWALKVFDWQGNGGASIIHSVFIIEFREASLTMLGYSSRIGSYRGIEKSRYDSRASTCLMMLKRCQIYLYGLKASWTYEVATAS